MPAAGVAVGKTHPVRRKLHVIFTKMYVPCSAIDGGIQAHNILRNYCDIYAGILAGNLRSRIQVFMNSTVLGEDQVHAQIMKIQLLDSKGVVLAEH